MTSEETRFAATGILGSVVLRLLGRSLRWRVEGTEHYEAFRREGRPVVFVFWHCWILPLAYLHRDQGVVVLTSRHRDGEYISRTIRRLGFGSARGSSTRGGAEGLRGLIRAARAGHDLAFTPDGPRGPARELKPGALIAAQLLEAPIIPVAVRTSRVWRLDTWDGFVIPKPLARIRVSYGPPHFIPRDCSRSGLEGHARTLERWLEDTEVMRRGDSGERSQ